MGSPVVDASPAVLALVGFTQGHSHSQTHPNVYYTFLHTYDASMKKSGEHGGHYIIGKGSSLDPHLNPSNASYTHTMHMLSQFYPNQRIIIII